MALLIDNMTPPKTKTLAGDDPVLCNKISEFLSACNHWDISKLCNNVTIRKKFVTRLSH
jgi:hypothetical protein